MKKIIKEKLKKKFCNHKYLKTYESCTKYKYKTQIRVIKVKCSNCKKILQENEFVHGVI